MREGDYRSEGEDGAYAELDEFLCEYVDGTMDAAVRAAFEEYLRLNPSLHEHVECLRATRSMLCRYGCRLRAPAALQQRLKERLGEEMMGASPVMPLVADRLSWIAGLSSVLLLLCGSLVANHLLKPANPPREELVATDDARMSNALDPIAGLDLLAPASALAAGSFAVRRPATRMTHAVEMSRPDSMHVIARPFRPALQTAVLP